MTIKISAHNWIRPEPLAETIERLGRLGYDALEISADPHDIDLDEVRRLLDQHSVAVSGALALIMGGRDLVHEDRYIREASVQYLIDTIDMSADLGGSFVTVPCTVGKVVPMASAEDEWKWYVDGLKRAQAHATERGLRLGIEPITRYETYLINRADQALRLAEEVGPDCGVALDIFHMNIEEKDWRGAIQACAPRLVNFHVADNNRLAPGDGALDWSAVLGELAGVGYDGHIAVEFMPALDRTPLSRIQLGDAADAGLSEGMTQWLRDHASGVLTANQYEDFMRTSIDTLRAALAQS